MSFPKYSTYKDSGGEWIGDIPDHWSANPLKRAFKIEGGSTPTPDEVNWDGDITWVTPADLSGLSSLFLDASKRTITAAGLASCGTTLLPAGSLILSTRAPIGSLAIALIKVCTNQGCKGLVPNADTSSAYFAYVLLTAKAELNNRGKGTTFLEISGDELGRFVVPTPSFPEQTQIARFLDHETARIDALIEEQQRLIELLKEKRQAVISHAVTKGLDPTVPMKDSGVEWLGEVPAHWGVRKFFFGIQKIIDNRGRSPSYVDSGIPILEARQLSDEGMECSSDFTKYISEESHSEFVRDDVVAGDVLMVTVGTIGKVGMVGENPGFVILQNIVGFRVGSDIDPGFMAIYLKSGAAFMAMQATNKESILSSVKVSDFIQHKMPLPPLAEQKAIVYSVNTELSKYGELQKEAELLCSTLHERRSALISAAVTGKIDVRGWQPPANAQAPESAVAEAN